MQQLHMVHPDPASAPQAQVGPLPEGVLLRSYRPGDEQAWGEIVNTTDMGRDYDPSKVRQSLTEKPMFDPEGLFFACDARSGRPLATACAWWTHRWGRPRPTLHMVAGRPEAKGRGLGRLVCQAVLNYFARRGEREVILSTDDHRLPALTSYLRLGWLPIRYVRGEDHTARWKALGKQLSAKCGRLRFAGGGRKLALGVLGLRRGAHLAALAAEHAAVEVVAGADAAEAARRSFAGRFPRAKLSDGLEELLEGPAEAVIVANDCPQHAPAAVAALRAGKDVLSEVTAFHTPAEGVALIEAVEETDRAYMLAENCLYSNAMMELGHLAYTGELGPMQYAEGDYVHDIREMMTVEGRKHWRGWLPPLFYCTHPLGPILRAAGERPVRVVGMHTGSKLPRTAGGIDLGAMLVQTAGGAAVRIASAFAVNRSPASLWVCFYGARASLESDRWQDKVYFFDGKSPSAAGPTSYCPTGRDGRSYTAAGHFGADARMAEYWVEALANGLAMPVDVYEATAMTLPGILAHRSSLQGSAALEVPDLRDPAAREACRADRARPDPDNPFRIIDT